MPPSRRSSLLALALLVALTVVTPAGAQDPVGAEVDVDDNVFEPDEVTVAVGEAVEWTWIGGNNHNVTAEDGTFASATQRAGTFSQTFDEVGTFGYFCSIHQGMDGTVNVTQDGTSAPPDPTDPAPDPQPAPAPDPQPQPVTGDDPVQTALAWSALLPDGQTDTALIGTDGAFADSLASGAAQGLLDAPLLLTDGEALDPRVVDELDRLGVDTTIILGGTAAVSEQVESDLAAVVTTVDRAGGGTRLETARAVADMVAPDARQVILARAFGDGSAGFADALGAGAVAGASGRPVLLTPTEGLDPALADWLQARGVEEVQLVGGTAALSAQVADDVAALGIEVRRTGGGSRFGTARQLAVADGQPSAPLAVVEGAGDLAWASGFAAALHAPGGVLLSAGEGPLPGDTLDALLGAPAVICGPTIGEPACDQARVAQAASDDDALRAVMDGDQETAAETQLVGASGLATVLPAGVDGACALVEAYDLSGPIAAAHIHQAGFGQAGEVVIGLDLQPIDGSTTRIACTGGVEAAVVQAVRDDPEGHYVNVHTELNPGGEVRGQLFDADTTVLSATLTGAAEVPGPGDPDAVGSAQVFDTGIPDQLCYVIDQGGLAPAATAAHIHEGDAATAGPIAHTLSLGAGGLSAHCDRGVDPALVTAIFVAPAEHYVNLHNDPFPAGAIRGQLAADSI